MKISDLCFFLINLKFKNIYLLTKTLRFLKYCSPSEFTVFAVTLCYIIGTIINFAKSCLITKKKSGIDLYSLFDDDGIRHELDATHIRHHAPCTACPLARPLRELYAILRCKRHAL